MSGNCCPLCRCVRLVGFYRDTKRHYWQCGQCDLVFVGQEFLLSASKEKAEYDLHENDIFDQGYRRFLNRLAQPLLEIITPPAKGLDFGCGPGPALQDMLQSAGFEMDIYDIFYAPHKAVFDRYYDFITATEVVEHLHNPHWELDRLWSRVNPQGVLAIMTKRVQSQAAFATWHYKNDLTHVCFFSESTFRWLAEQWGATLTFPAADVVLLQKP
ncbi:class I SAM-dependent methyltransferase [Gilvimarinus sp. 1_MG-2023]|nr:class I SAM-dependent methyltransferase [Gilvimarinus sp. 1_MG-2023]MDO6747672.1 class I SAM-dependent methyltransferase [Gilvimarinus sp. 1_MG-2023]